MSAVANTIPDSAPPRVQRKKGTPARAPYYWQQWMWFLSLLPFVCSQFGSVFEADPDLFARLAVGSMVLKSGSVTTVDPFSYAPKNPLWIDHEWLAGVVFHMLWQWGGDGAIVMAKYVIAAGSLAIWWLAMTRYNKRSPGLFALCALGAVNLCFVWFSTLRSQAFTYLFLPAELLIFAEAEVHGRISLLWLLPLMMLPWCNLHGGFVVGLGLHLLWSIGMQRKGRMRWRLFLPLFASLGATCINPYGPITYWGYILHAVTMHRGYIPEWDPIIPFTSVWATYLSLGVLVTVVAITRAPVARPRLTSLFCGAASVYFGFKHFRLSAIPVFVLPVFFGDAIVSWFSQVFRTSNYQREITKAAPIAWILLSAYFCCETVIHGLPKHLSYDTYPVKAMDWLAASHPEGGRILTGYNAGSYVLWRVGPKFQVSFDGRYEELYPDATYELVIAAFSPTPDRAKHLEAWGRLNPNFILVPKSNPTFVVHAEEIGPFGSQIVYEDGKYLLLVPKTPTDGSSAIPRTIPDI